MAENKKEDLYETLFRISQGDVDLLKEETKDFLTKVATYTGASVKMQRESAAPQPVQENQEERGSSKR